MKTFWVVVVRMQTRFRFSQCMPCCGLTYTFINFTFIVDHKCKNSSQRFCLYSWCWHQLELSCVVAWLPVLTQLQEVTQKCILFDFLHKMHLSVCIFNEVLSCKYIVISVLILCNLTPFFLKLNSSFHFHSLSFSSLNFLLLLSELITIQL